jgi:hypothetical protein
VPLSHTYAQAGALDASRFQALGTLLLEAKEINSILTVVFCLGALIFNYMLYQTKLVPRWLSGWGLIAIVPYLAAGLLTMFDFINASSPIYAILNLPLALQEMVLAVWLIARGFNSSATVFSAAKTELNAV